MREGTLFEAGKKDVIEFEALGGVEGQQGDRRAIIEVVGVTHEGGAVEEILERFATLGTFGDGVYEFAKVFGARDVFGGIALAKHVEIAGDIENGGQKLRGRQRGLLLAQVFDERAEAAQGGEGAAAAGVDGFAEGVPKGGSVLAGERAQDFDGSLADTAWRRVENAQEGDIVGREHGE